MATRKVKVDVDAAETWLAARGFRRDDGSTIRWTHLDGLIAVRRCGGSWEALALALPICSSASDPFGALAGLNIKLAVERNLFAPATAHAVVIDAARRSVIGILGGDRWNG